VIFAAAGIHEIVRIAGQRRGRPLALYGLGLGAAALVVGWDLGVPESSRAVAYYNLAVSLERQGEAASAAESYKTVLDESPDFVQAHVNLGALLARSGDFAGGINQERAALKLKPDDAIAHTDLGNALYELGRLDEAEGHYRAALSAQPGLAEAEDGLAAVSNAKRQASK
jgi:Flp pilus assembly protein TadD